jgi:hypothetical protein
LDNQEADWDIFISHASEDKLDLVAPIADILRRFGLRVWYDAFSLSIGDSLSRSIDVGLAKSRFGLVVLSPSFFAKDWPDYELRGLTARELGRGKVILPLWHRVTRDDVLAFSPPLADKLAVGTSGLTPLQIAVKVIEVVSPQLFERIHRRLAFLSAAHSAPVRTADVETIRESPIRHETLPEDQFKRIRLIRAALLEVYPVTMQDWVDGFRRDLHPADEILIWEHYASVFLEVATYLKLGAARRRDLYLLLVTAMQGASKKDIMKALKKFSEREALLIERSLRSAKPVVEVVHTVKSAGDDRRGSKRRMATKAIDIPDDDTPLPDELPRELMDELLPHWRATGVQE